MIEKLINTNNQSKLTYKLFKKFKLFKNVKYSRGKIDNQNPKNCVS